MFAKLNFYSLNISENMLLFPREIYLLDLVLNEHIYETSFEEKKRYFTEKCYRGIYQEIWQGNTSLSILFNF